MVGATENQTQDEQKETDKELKIYLLLNMDMDDNVINWDNWPLNFKIGWNQSMLILILHERSHIDRLWNQNILVA